MEKKSSYRENYHKMNRKQIKVLWCVALLLSVIGLSGGLFLKVSSKADSLSFAQASDFEYVLDDSAGTITLGQYKGKATDLVIPGKMTVGTKEYVVYVDGKTKLYKESLEENETDIKTISFVPVDGQKVVAVGHTPDFGGTYLSGKRTQTLSEIDLSGLDTAQVTSLIRAFCGCNALKTINFGDIDTSSVESMEAMFESCNMDTLDLSRFDLSSVKTMEAMFYSFKANEVKWFENTDTPHLENVWLMFSNSSSIREIDLSALDFSNLTEHEVFSPQFLYGASLYRIITPKKIGKNCHESLKTSFRETPGTVYYDAYGNPYNEINVDTPTATALYNKKYVHRYNGAKITYVLNEGTNDSRNTPIFFPDITYTFHDATRKGYTFTGWYEDEECTKKVTELRVTGSWEEEDFDDITLYAGWEKSEDASSEGIYADAACTLPVSEEEAEIYANGAKVRDTAGQITNYRVAVYYTNLTEPSYTTVQNGKTKSKTGKVIVGLTDSSDMPAVKNNKIVSDAALKKLASVSYKKANHSITVTAKNIPGTVYVWVVSLTEKDTISRSAYVKVQVLPAPNKLEILDKPTTDQNAAAYKKDTVCIGGKVQLYLNPTMTISGKKQNITGGDYTLSPASGVESLVSVGPMSDGTNGYIVVAAGLKNNKKTSVKLTAQCLQSGKKATFTLTILNYTIGENLEKGSGVVSLGDKKQISGTSSLGTYNSYETVIQAPTDKLAVNAQVNVSPVLASSEYAATDKPKVYTMSSESGFTINQKGAVKITGKPAGINAKIKASIKNDTVTIKAPKKLSADASTYILVVYNTYSSAGYFVMPVRVAG